MDQGAKQPKKTSRMSFVARDQMGSNGVATLELWKIRHSVRNIITKLRREPQGRPPIPLPKRKQKQTISVILIILKKVLVFLLILKVT